MSKRALADIDTTPTKGMIEEATQGLEWRREFGRGGTAVGVARARDIKNGKDLSISTIKRMYSFFRRHEIDKKAEGFRVGEEGYPSNGRIAWALWGGDAGYSWSTRKVKEIKKEEERKLSDKITKGLENKVEKHNEEVKDLKVSWNPRVTLAKLVKVFERGVGAYKTNPESVRPSVDNPDQWAYARVNSFLYALKKGKFRGGKHDTDLLPPEHPVRKEMDKKYNKLMENKELKSIQRIEETEDSIIIYYGKDKVNMGNLYEDKEMDKEDKYMDEEEERGKVGALITDGIELPLYETIEEAEEEAERLGGEGYHEHTLYMPFENHDQAKEVLGKDKESSEENLKEEAMGHEEEEDKSEIRNIPNKEVRTFNVENLELRVDIDNKTVVGYGAVFGSLSNDLGGFREVIDPKAFEGRLEDDVRFLINHDGLPLARTTNKTLRLSIDEKGLRYEATMPDTTLSNDLMELLKNGTVSQSSFAFIVEDDSWEVKDGVNIRTINKVSRLFDVSAVTYPAYEEASSSVALRSLEEWKEEESNKKLKDNLEKEKKENLKEMQDLHKRNLAELKLKLIK